MGKFWSALFAVIMILCGGMFVVAPFYDWWLPEGVSAHAHLVDNLFYIILAITGFFFILTEGLLILFMWRYSDQGWKAPSQAQGISFFGRLMKPVAGLLHDQHRVEMAWTLVPALILLYIAFAQVDTWADVKYQSRMPDSEERPMQVEVSARQFAWRMRYPSSERFREWMTRKDDATLKDFKSFAIKPQHSDVYIVNELHVWKDHPVLVHLSTRDVLHSFNLPQMRVKQDALPGKIIPVWFTPIKGNTGPGKQPGTFVDGINPHTGKADRHFIWDLACAELCGWGHYRMVGRAYVHKDQNEFLEWLVAAEANAHARKVDSK